MKITALLLKAACPGAKVDLVETAKYINLYFPKYGINTNRRVRYILAQCMQETDGLKTFKEYASGEAYENRGDLGNNRKGDGRRFPGRGLIMTTGRNNYQRLQNWLEREEHLAEGVSIIDSPELLRTPKYAVLSACFYIVDHRYGKFTILQICDSGDFEKLTRAINGGLNGYATRLEYLGRLNKLLGKEAIEFEAFPAHVYVENKEPQPIVVTPPIEPKPEAKEPTVVVPLPKSRLTWWEMFIDYMTKEL